MIIKYLIIINNCSDLMYNKILNVLNFYMTDIIDIELYEEDYNKILYYYPYSKNSIFIWTISNSQNDTFWNSETIETLLSSIILKNGGYLIISKIVNNDNNNDNIWYNKNNLMITNNNEFIKIDEFAKKFLENPIMYIKDLKKQNTKNKLTINKEKIEILKKRIRNNK